MKLRLLMCTAVAFIGVVVTGCSHHQTSRCPTPTAVSYTPCCPQPAAAPCCPQPVPSTTGVFAPPAAAVVTPSPAAAACPCPR
jgi:hypothetical protein